MALTMFCTAAVSKDEEEDLCHASSEEEQRMSLIKQQTAQRFLNELSFWEVESRTDSDSASSQRQEEEKERKKQEPGQWKTAMDPNSGRTYYYHSVTRQTQWEKVRLGFHRARDFSPSALYTPLTVSHHHHMSFSLIAGRDSSRRKAHQARKETPRSFIF